MIHREAFRQTWKIDLTVCLLWVFWVIFVSALELPFWLNLTGTSWILLYAAWRWNWVQAAIIFLLMGWFLRTLSLMPSGLYWLSLIIIFLIVKLARFRLMVRNAFQFASSAFAVCILLHFLQMFLLSRIYPDAHMGWYLLGAFFASAFAQAILGFFIYSLFDKISGAR